MDIVTSDAILSLLVIFMVINVVIEAVTNSDDLSVDSLLVYANALSVVVVIMAKIAGVPPFIDATTRIIALLIMAIILARKAYKLWKKFGG